MSLLAAMLPVLPPRGVPKEAARRLHAAVDALLEDLPQRPVLLLLRTGSEPLVEDVRSLAVPGGSIEVSGAPAVVATIVSRGQVPLVRTSALAGPVAQLATTIHTSRPDSRFVSLTVPVGADPTALVGVAAALDGVLATADELTLVVPGDLVVADEATRNRTLAALEAADPMVLAALGHTHPEVLEPLVLARLAVGVARARGVGMEVRAAEAGHGRLHVVGRTR